MPPACQPQPKPASKTLQKVCAASQLIDADADADADADVGNQVLPNRGFSARLVRRNLLLLELRLSQAEECLSTDRQVNFSLTYESL